ncbi:MAG: oligosaccharide flippase family protein [Cyanobacteria bacterium P01_A01_bin.105]
MEKQSRGAVAILQTLGARVFILANNVATGMITARFLGAEGRGEQAAMIVWAVFFANLMTFGLPSALIYQFKRYPQDQSVLFSAALISGGALGVVATAIGIFLMPMWLSNYSPEVIFYARVFMLLAPLGLLQQVFAAAFEASGDFIAANQLRCLIPLVTLVTLVGLAVTGQLTPLTSAMAYTLNSVPVFGWMLRRLWRRFQPSWQGWYGAAKRLLTYGLRAYGNEMLNALSLQLDQVLVVGLLSAESMGIYVVALSLSRMLRVFQAAMTTVLFPKVAAQPLGEIVSLTTRVNRINLALTLMVGIGLVGLGPRLLPLLYGDEFVAATGVFRLLVVEIILSGATQILAQALMAAERPGVVTAMQTTGISLNALLAVLLIPRYGLMGAGIALVSATAVRLVLVLGSYPLVLRVGVPALVMGRGDVAFIRHKLGG